MDAVPPRRPRDPRLDALLHELDALRLGLQGDLSVVAAAVESDRVEEAVAQLGDDRDALAAFGARADAVLAGGAPEPAEPAEVAESAEPAEVAEVADLAARGRWRLPALTAAAAAAVLAAALTAPAVSGPEERTLAGDGVLASYTGLAGLSSDASGDEVRAAAEALHAQVEALLQGPDPDGTRAAQAAALLQAERAILGARADAPALSDVDAEAASLLQRLAGTLPQLGLPAGVPALPPLPLPVPLPSAVPPLPTAVPPLPTAVPARPAPTTPAPTAPASPTPAPTTAPTAPAPARTTAPGLPPLLPRGGG